MCIIKRNQIYYPYLNFCYYLYPSDVPKVNPFFFFSLGSDNSISLECTHTHQKRNCVWLSICVSVSVCVSPYLALSFTLTMLDWRVHFSQLHQLTVPLTIVQPVKFAVVAEPQYFFYFYHTSSGGDINYHNVNVKQKKGRMRGRKRDVSGINLNILAVVSASKFASTSQYVSVNNERN